MGCSWVCLFVLRIVILPSAVLLVVGLPLSMCSWLLSRFKEWSQKTILFHNKEMRTTGGTPPPSAVCIHDFWKNACSSDCSKFFKKHAGGWASRFCREAKATPWDRPGIFPLFPYFSGRNRSADHVSSSAICVTSRQPCGELSYEGLDGPVPHTSRSPVLAS